MVFKSLLEKYLLELEADGQEEPKDASVPDENAPVQPDNVGKQETAQVPPYGYVDLIKLLAKALVINIPSGSIDSLFTVPVTQENALDVREGLEDAIKQNENYGDNPERLESPAVKKFINSINEGNFYNKYKQLLSIINNPGNR